MLDDTPKYDAHGWENAFLYRNKAKSSLLGIGNFSRAIYRLGY